jgi:hypothetical protein
MPVALIVSCFGRTSVKDALLGREESEITYEPRH